MVPTVQFTKQMSTLPTNKKFGKLDPEFCMEQAHWIIKNIPCFEQDDIARVWRFHVDSEVPLLREAAEHIKKCATGFDKVFRRSPKVTFFVFTETLKDREETVWFKDKVSWGQFHFAISGGSNILIDNGTKVNTIKVDDGSAWYLNSADYMHRINEMNGAERLELYAPLNQTQTFINDKMPMVVDNKWKYLKQDIQ